MTESVISTGRGRSLVSRAAQLSVLLAFVSLLLLAVGPLGWRLGWWHFRLAFFTLMPYSAYLAIAGAVVSAGTLLFLRSAIGERGVRQAAGALVVCAILFYVPWSWNNIRTAVPSIHDISTDTDNPPAFQAVLAARKAEQANTEVYGGPEVATLQKGFYTDLAPVTLTQPPAEAFKRALETAKAMAGWTIVDTDPASGRIEASQSSFWFGFTDDVVIRVAPNGAGSRVDMRSEARQGRSDFGKNAERIRKYMAALKAG